MSRVLTDEQEVFVLVCLFLPHLTSYLSWLGIFQLRRLSGKFTVAGME